MRRMDRYQKNTTTVTRRDRNEELYKELILDNHSLVMYDHDLIPKDEIWEENKKICDCSQIFQIFIFLPF